MPNVKKASPSWNVSIAWTISVRHAVTPCTAITTSAWITKSYSWMSLFQVKSSRNLKSGKSLSTSTSLFWLITHPSNSSRVCSTTWRTGTWIRITLTGSLNRWTFRVCLWTKIMIFWLTFKLKSWNREILGFSGRSPKRCSNPWLASTMRKCSTWTRLPSISSQRRAQT